MNVGQSSAPNANTHRKAAGPQLRHAVVATGEEPFGAFPAFLISVFHPESTK